MDLRGWGWGEESNKQRWKSRKTSESLNKPEKCEKCTYEDRKSTNVTVVVPALAQMIKNGILRHPAVLRFAHTAHKNGKRDGR